MAGIYIHIPFCKQACHYCDFHFSTSLKNKDAFIQALIKEIDLRKNYLPANTIYSTIYFGGGSPSILTESDLKYIFEKLYSAFKIAPNAEVTLEANPDDLTKEKVSQLVTTPVNRLSIGIQSFRDSDLKLMNRAHNAAEADYCVKLAQDKGFENITIDLIYGIPDLSLSDWNQNIQKAFALSVQHISAYCLTVEPKTALAHMVKTGKVSAMNDALSTDHFYLMLDEMDKHKFIQYEISNFGKENYFSKHNTSYWFKEPYLGLGPSAHSYNGEQRQWNISNNPLYIKALFEGKLNAEHEQLSESQRYNEYVLTRLRTMWGVSLEEVLKLFGSSYKEYALLEAEPYLAKEHLILEENTLTLSRSGKLMADRIAGDLFFVE